MVHLDSRPTCLTKAQWALVRATKYQFHLFLLLLEVRPRLHKVHLDSRPNCFTKAQWALVRATQYQIQLFLLLLEAYLARYFSLQPLLQPQREDCPVRLS